MNLHHTETDFSVSVIEGFQTYGNASNFYVVTADAATGHHWLPYWMACVSLIA
jgi:hypothetical protein